MVDSGLRGVRFFELVAMIYHRGGFICISSESILAKRSETLVYPHSCALSVCLKTCSLPVHMHTDQPAPPHILTDSAFVVFPYQGACLTQ